MQSAWPTIVALDSTIVTPPLAAGSSRRPGEEKPFRCSSRVSRFALLFMKLPDHLDFVVLTRGWRMERLFMEPLPELLDEIWCWSHKRCCEEILRPLTVGGKDNPVRPSCILGQLRQPRQRLPCRHRHSPQVPVLPTTVLSLRHRRDHPLMGDQHHVVAPDLGAEMFGLRRTINVEG